MKKQKSGNSEVVTWKGQDDKEKMMVLYNTALEEALEEVRPIVRTFNSNIYQDAYSPSISIRDEFNRNDYEYYRPGEGIPTDDKGKIKACLDAYNKSGYGIVKNIVDLMADFTVQGIDVAYPNKKAQKLLKYWFHKIIKGPERSKRFANLACKASTIIVKRETSKVPLKIIRKLYKTDSKADKEYVEEKVETEKREIPTNYTFLHPLSVDPIAPELSAFLSNKKRLYGLKVPANLIQRIRFPSVQDAELIKEMPKDIVNQIRAGNTVIALDKEKVDVYYYNKEDWEVWATPMIYTVLSDLRHLEKLKLADLSALDGAISQIRIWRIGDIEKGIKPSAAAVTKLSQILMNSVSGGFLDLVWTQDLQFEEVTSNLHNFLGETKYVPILNSIYTGLGIPPLFTGSTNQGSFTNNYIAIKTMVERLEAIRNLLKEFWSREFEIVAKAFGLDKEITLTFDRMTLNDESSVLQIMLHLVDRNYLSIEAIQEMVGANPEVEEFRIRREWKEQESGARPPKASQFHKAEWKETWIDSFIKMGELTPSEVGLELEPRAKGEISPAERKAEEAVKKLKTDIGGRPKGKKDATKRKSKTVKPRRSVSNLMNLVAWSTEAQSRISNIITPAFLESVSKKNLRQLTENEFAHLERLKFSTLASISPYKAIDSEFIISVLQNPDTSVPVIMDTMLKQMIEDYSQSNEITTDKVRELQAIVYAAYNVEESEEE
jgi:hypothetical protein